MTKKTNKVSLKQRMINWVKATGKDGMVVDKHGYKYYAGIRGNYIRVQEYNECEMLLNDYSIAL